MCRRVAIGALLFVAACAEPAVEPPQAGAVRSPVEVRSAVDRAVATTGDLITYRVTVDHDPAWRVEVPEAGAQIAGFRIVDAGFEPERTVGDRRQVERWYRLRADLVGSYVLPPVVVSFARADGGEAEAGSVESSAIFVEVESVLPTEGGADDIRDVKPPRRVAERWPWGWIAAVAAALGAGIGWLFWRRRRRGRWQEPEMPADEWAFAALDSLRGTDFDDPVAVRRFYFAISEVIRTYVEGRFGVNATDLTTQEIVVAVAGLDLLGDTERGELGRFLADTDLVKFADRQPTKPEIETTWERALGFVEATRPQPRPEAVEARAA